jgi:hypothetical protein
MIKDARKKVTVTSSGFLGENVLNYSSSLKVQFEHVVADLDPKSDPD